MTDKPLTLVRLWGDRYRKPLGCAWVEWHGGKFSLPADDPAAIVIRNEMVIPLATVSATPEFLWEINQWELRADKRVYVTAESYAEALRGRLTSDLTLTEVWLRAERDWLESQRKTCRSEKPSHRRWIAPRTGGYRPGGDFRADANHPPPTPTTAPKGPGGVIPRSRSER